MKRNGFTLLEMLVVLAVFGLLMVAITEAMRFAGTASQLAQKSSSWTSEIEPADRAVRTIIEQIRPQETLETAKAIDGAADHIGFKAELSDPTLALGHAQDQVTLGLDPAASGTGYALVATTQPAPHAEWIGAPSPIRKTRLVDGLAGASFAYWDGKQWLDNWHQDGLPRLVRIRLRFPEGDPRHWPDIIASPMRDSLP